jgi:hypothetical protein
MKQNSLLFFMYFMCTSCAGMIDNETQNSFNYNLHNIDVHDPVLNLSLALPV